MKKRNPRTSAQPDLFLTGDTRGHIRLEDVPYDKLLNYQFDDYTDEELYDLPEEIVEALIKRDKPARKDFTDERWAMLTEDAQELVRENDPRSQDRINALTKFFMDRWDWLMHPDDNQLFSDVEDQLEMHLAEDDLVALARDTRHSGGYDVDDLIESWTADGFSDEQVEEALRDALQDQNNWALTSGSEYGNAFFKLGRGEQSYYIDSDEIDEAVEGMSDDEIDEALKEVNRKTYLELENDASRPQGIKQKYGLDIMIDTGDYVDADPDWDKIEEAVKDTLEDKDPEGAEKPIPPVDEKRVLHRFSDGAYVLDLTPAELPREGQQMGHCVGRPGMGYGRAVHNGEIKILSLRTQNGRPKFTIEASTRGTHRARGHTLPGDITAIKQIKGKANRLPGWDLGKVGEGQVKKDEVEKLVEFVGGQGLDPYDVRDLVPGLAALEPGFGLAKIKKTNPVNRKSSACGVHGENCTGFCAPYSSL